MDRDRWIFSNSRVNNPDQPWPIVTFQVAVKCNSYFYAKALLLPSLGITYMAIFVEFISLKQPEKLALLTFFMIMNAVLNMYASSITPHSKTPLWIDDVMVGGSTFVYVVFFVNVVSSYLYWRNRGELISAFNTYMGDTQSGSNTPADKQFTFNPTFDTPDIMEAVQKQKELKGTVQSVVKRHFYVAIVLLILYSLFIFAMLMRLI